MIIPEEMREFAGSFHQDIDYAAKTLTEIIDEQIKRLSLDRRKTVIEYLKQLLVRTRDADTLMDVWLGAQAEWGVDKEAYPFFFDLLVQRFQNLDRK